MRKPTHQHYFRRATVLDAKGAPMQDGRRCVCGIETVGEIGVNAALVRAGQNFNTAVVVGLTDLAARVRAAQDRTRER